MEPGPPDSGRVQCVKLCVRCSVDVDGGEPRRVSPAI